MRQFFLLWIIPFFLVSCLQTVERANQEKEEIKGEQIELSSQVVSLQQDMHGLKKDFTQFAGKLEEVQNNQKEEEKNKSVETQIIELQKELLSQAEKIQKLEADIETHRNFISEITNTLSENKNVSTPTATPANDDGWKKAVTLYKNKYYKKAKPLLQKYLEDSHLSANQKAQTLHHLGLIEYKAKNYSESLVFLSQLYTDYPKSSFVPEGLFYIGLSFSQQKKTEEAALSWNEVIKKFPKSAPAKMAKEKLTALR